MRILSGEEGQTLAFRASTYRRGRNSAVKILRDERGQAAVFGAVCLTVVMGAVALAIDVGQLRFQQQRLQAAADAAAMAGALEVSTCGSTSNCSAMQTAAKSAVVEDGWATPTVVTQCASSGASGLILQVNNGPCALGSTDPNNANTQFVEAVVKQKQNTFFGAILGLPQITVAARSEATSGGPAPACIYTLGTVGITGSGTGSISASNCVVEDNGNIDLAGTESISASKVLLEGTNTVGSGSSVTPSPTSFSGASDPLAGKLTAPNCSSYTAVNVAAGGTYSPPAGTNCFSGINCAGSCTINLTSNTTYTINSSGWAINASGNVTINGTGTTLYIPGGGVAVSGNLGLNLTAPTSGSLDGIALWVPSTNSASFFLSGSSSSTLDGIIYAPASSFTISGTNTVTMTTNMIVGNLTYSGAFNLNNYTATNTTTALGSGSSTALAE
jgi:Flp pilus assembly protein TadG